MTIQRKIVIAIIACLLGVSILLLAVVIIAPKVIDSKAVRDKVRSEIKETAVAYELAEMMKKTVARPINLIHGGKAPEKNSKERE